MKLILKWLLSASALLLVAFLYPGVQIQSFTAALIAAAVMGLLNTLVRPVLVVLPDERCVPAGSRDQFVQTSAPARRANGWQLQGFQQALAQGLQQPLV